MADLERLNDELGSHLLSPERPQWIADGVQWIDGGSELIASGNGQDRRYSALNTYLIVGEDKTLLIDTSHPASWCKYLPALAKALGERTLDYVMLTQPTIAHAGSLTLLVDAYPDVKVVGDTRDYFLYHPDVPESAYLPMAPGDKLDLGGGRVFEFVDPVVRDLVNTLWGFDHRSRTLFPSGGFAFFARDGEDGRHRAAHAQSMTPEVGTYWMMTQVVSGIALQDQASRISRFQALIERLQPKVLGAAYGTVVTDVSGAMAYLHSLRGGRRDDAQDATCR